MRISCPNRLALVIAMSLSAGPAARLAAQLDYRNLDDDRPTLIEDAYPVERYAFELLLAPVRIEREKRGVTIYGLVPELEYGLLSNVQVGVKLPLAGHTQGGTSTWALGGLRLFGLYNLNTETTWPALALRADAVFPVGGHSAGESRLSLKGIATRTLGRSRLHLNGAYTFGRDRRIAPVENPDRWWGGVAIDRTLPFRSTLLLAEVYARRPRRGDPVEVNASAGVRYQVSPTLVLDAGVGRGLRRGLGPEWSVTLGFSRAIGFAGLIPEWRRE